MQQKRGGNRRLLQEFDQGALREYNVGGVPIEHA
jgi:hypothetical protein